MISLAKRAPAALALFVLVGCKTVPIGPPLTLPVPAGLSPKDAQIAIVTMLEAPRARRGNETQANTYTFVVANPIGAMLWDQYRQAKVRSKNWFLESWAHDQITAGYQHGLYYLQLGIDVTPKQVSLTILGSRHLDQHQGQIHRHAKIWVEMLETDIADALGRALLAKHQLQQ